MTWLLELDRWLYLEMRGCCADYWVQIFFWVITQLGHGLVLLILLAPVLLINKSTRSWRILLALAITLTVLGLAIWAIKTGVARQRPFDDYLMLKRHLARNSFPSGHTATAFGVAACFYVLLPRLGRWFLAVAPFVGISRICLGSHYPLDVVAGTALGLAIPFLLLPWLLRLLGEVPPQGGGDAV